ncbi:hypothetical protein LTR53_011367 [Teratosphaeriaceae sp. CCFEE 6253]|nr:hypothetical protein LTR53_011367 [Teratosphaeriaceae sp. CCFEE 6253]
MATLLTAHLDQISLCSSSIAGLPFPAPKIFANALLHTHDITALIRDTEAHERALFHLAPPPQSLSNTAPVPPSAASAGARRATTHGASRPKSRAVAAVLGGDLYQRTRSANPGDTPGRHKGELDVEVLLQGAERLGASYLVHRVCEYVEVGADLMRSPIPGAAEKISALRARHQQLAANIAHYEDRVARNAQELQLMNRPPSRGGEREDVEVVDPDEEEDAAGQMTRHDLKVEEEEVRRLEGKKKGLEERVSGMEKDLGGLMR